MAKFAFVVDGEVGLVWKYSGNADIEMRTEACLMSNPEIIKIEEDVTVLTGWTYDGETFSPPTV
jgi:hypothetical protein